MRLLAIVAIMIGLVLGIMEAFSTGDLGSAAILGAGLLVAVVLTNKVKLFR